MNKYYVEKFNASDDTFKITDFYKKSGSYVNYGELICTIETSKADIDIEAQVSGYLFHIKAKGDVINVGELFYIITENDQIELQNIFSKSIQENICDFTISSKARILLEENNISPDVLGKKIIKESDVLEFINKKNIPDLIDKINTRFESNSILILGGQGGAKMCIDAIRSKSEFEIIGIVDSKLRVGDLVSKIPVIGGENLLFPLYKKGINKIVVSFSSLKNLTKRQEKINELKKIGFQLPNIFHSQAVIESSSSFGEGNIVLASSIIGSCCQIGSFNYVNTGAIICHDAIVENNNHFAPNSVIAGRINIGNNNLIGINVSTFYDITIGSNVIINNGVSVNTNVSDFAILKK
jgi:sugar O-acyltransferase (sialic acid O-acetyltransferase NeuD family)